MCATISLSVSATAYPSSTGHGRLSRPHTPSGEDKPVAQQESQTSHVQAEGAAPSLPGRVLVLCGPDPYFQLTMSGGRVDGFSATDAQLAFSHPIELYDHVELADLTRGGPVHGDGHDRFGRPSTQPVSA